VLLSRTTTALWTPSIWTMSLTPCGQYLANASDQADPGDEQTACASAPVTDRASAPVLASITSWTICESGATGGVSEFPLSSGAGAAEFEHVFVASSNLRMHHDVTANSFARDELTGALLLR
jgi:hypothetical protein